MIIEYSIKLSPEEKVILLLQYLNRWHEELSLFLVLLVEEIN
jgi:hypothetical protein